MDLDKFRCNRNQFVEALKAENIESIIYYPIPLTKQPALKKFVKNAYCPISEKLSNEVFSIPVHPSLTDEDLKLIVKAINKVATHYSK
jgi:UDP-2-acetamido-2-deoxy-ribo-hexuluronate aminotransferase